jgi:hypothetical protein
LMESANLQLPAPNPNDRNYSASLGSSGDWGSYLFFGGPNG